MKEMTQQQLAHIKVGGAGSITNACFAVAGAVLFSGHSTLNPAMIISRACLGAGLGWALGEAKDAVGEVNIYYRNLNKPHLNNDFNYNYQYSYY